MYGKVMTERIKGRGFRVCYQDLDLAVEIMCKCDDPDISMNEIADQVSDVTGKGRSSVLKSLSRAVEDIWEYGDRPSLELLYGFVLKEKPSPRELILRLAAYRNRAVEYHIGWDHKDQCCLIATNPVTKDMYRVIPLGGNALTLEGMVGFLNMTQASVEAVESFLGKNDELE